MYKMLLHNNSKHFGSGPKQESDHHFSFSLTHYFSPSDIWSINTHHVSTTSKALFQALLMIYEWESSLVSQLVKNPPAVQETPVQFLGRDDPMEKGQATHSNILGHPW